MYKIRPNFKQDVSETLLIPLYMRANESKEKKPIINDRISEKILSKVDYNFEKFSSDKRCQLCISVRTKYFDNVLKSFVEKYDDAVVVILACGLDPRTERVAIEKKYYTYEIDFPDVIDFRRKLLPESVYNQYIKDNINNKSWVETIKKNHPTGHFLFILEGVAMYLSESQIKNFFAMIDNTFENAEIYLERMNKYMSRNTHKQKSVNSTKAEFSWGCDNPKEIESWGNSFKFVNEHYYYNHSFKEMFRRFGFKALLLKYLPSYNRSIGIWSYKK